MFNEGLIKKIFKKYEGTNQKIVRDLLDNVEEGMYVSIIHKKGRDVTGRVLNVFLL